MTSRADFIPFLDLRYAHDGLRDEFEAVFGNAISSCRFIGGPELDGFEKEFAAFCEAEHAVGVASGTDALRLALIAVGVKPGDAVITVPNTFIATAEAISHVGGTPELVDIDIATSNMDPERLREHLESECRVEGGTLVSKRTRTRIAAIVPVHLYGQMAPMDPIVELAEKYGLPIVEDACQAHGARRRSSTGEWVRAGSVGTAAAFSFYPGKNLGACGEGGAVTTSSEDVTRAVRMLRDHGQARKHEHEAVGYNARLDAIQAGILRIKLRRLEEWNEERRAIAARYAELLRGIDGIELPRESADSRGVYHLYVVQTPARGPLMEHLAAHGIGTAIHYPVPIHLQDAYEHLGYREGDFPAAECSASRVVSLPMFPGLSPEQQQRVAAAIEQFAPSVSAS